MLAPKMQHLATLLLYLLCIGSSSAQELDDLTNNQLKSLYRNAVVFLAIRHEQDDNPGCEYGTGFIISSTGYVVTSSHLLRPPGSTERYSDHRIIGQVGEPFACDYPIGDLRELEVISTVQDQDAVLLKFRSEKTYEYVRACRETMFESQSSVAVMGFPLGQPLSVRSAEIENKSGPAGMWQFDAALNSGNSGGPVFSRSGRLIGLVYGDAKVGNDISFLVPLQHFGSLFSSAQAPLLDCETPSGQSPARVCEAITIEHPIDWVLDEHSGLSSISKPFAQTITAQPQHFIIDAQWIEKSSNNARGISIVQNSDQKSVYVSSNLSSGPVFDRWRGWVSGLLITREIPEACPRND